MKVLQKFFGICVAIALLGASFAAAEIRTESVQPLKFSVSAGDDSITLPDLTFGNTDSASGEEAQSTCAMTPGGPTPGGMLEMPIIPPVTPARVEPVQNVAFSAGALPSQRSYNERAFRGGSGGGGGGGGGGDTPPPPIIVVPEPATLVIVGLGIAGMAVARRRWRS